MKKKNPNYPQVIQSVLVRLETFIITYCLYGRAGIWRAMRKERQEAILKLLIVLAKSCALAYDGVFVRVVNGVAHPLTVLQMARLSGLSRSSAERCLADLRELGFIQSGKQILKSGPDGLECSAVMRKFTKAFWVKMGLWGQFVEAVKYSVAHCKLRISWVFKRVADKTKKVISGALAAKVPKEGGDRERQRQNAVFFEYLDCSKSHAPGCLGGYASEAACALCRKLRGGNDAALPH